MKYEKRKNGDGSVYYRFSHYNSKNKKVEHMSRDEVRRRFGKDILTEDEAEHCLKPRMVDKPHQSGPFSENYILKIAQ